MNNCLVCQKPTKHIYCSLSCSNTGRRPKNEAKYLLKPKICLLCGDSIPYDKRFYNKFCSSSCSASFTNSKRPKKVKEPKIQRDLHKEAVERFLCGQVDRRKTIRKILIEINGNKCSRCALPSIWFEQALTLTVDHVDGNAGNNDPSNLRLLCPNCHSQTSTFCGRNNGNGRQSRGLPKN